jgi:hypothetical protein
LTMTSSGPSPSRPLTTEGTMLGTFQYMSGASGREGSGRTQRYLCARRSAV